MCIFVKSYHLSNEPTECYKLVRRLPDECLVTSPFNTAFVWTIGKVYRDEQKEAFVPSEDYRSKPFFPRIGDEAFFLTREPKFKGELTQGVFHTFKTREGAEKLLQYFLKEASCMYGPYTSRDFAIVKCLIPKDTWFCYGEDAATGCECYGSKSLKIIKIL